MGGSDNNTLEKLQMQTLNGETNKNKGIERLVQSLLEMLFYFTVCDYLTIGTMDFVLIFRETDRFVVSSRQMINEE